MEICTIVLSSKPDVHDEEFSDFIKSFPRDPQTGLFLLTGVDVTQEEEPPLADTKYP